MTKDFQTEEMKNVFSSVLSRFEEETDDFFPIGKQPAEKIPSITSSMNSASTADAPPKKKTRKVKIEDFTKTTLARMSLHNQQSEDRLKRRKKFEEEKIMENVKQRPEINANSKKLGKRNLKIYERAEKELEVSKKKLEEKKKKILAEKEEKIAKELTFKPVIGECAYEKRTIEDFYQYNLEWKKRCDKRTEMRKAEIEEQENTELKFAPCIDENSENLVQSMGMNKEIVLRLLERAEFSKKKLEAKRKEAFFTFAPNIQKRSRRLGRKKNNESNVFTRLFSLSVDSKKDDKSPRFGGRIEHKSFSFPDEYSFER